MASRGRAAGQQNGGPLEIAVAQPAQRQVRILQREAFGHHPDRHALDRRCAAVLFSPVHGVLHPKDLSEWILGDRLPVRLQLQIHKHIWGADVRGV